MSYDYPVMFHQMEIPAAMVLLRDRTISYITHRTTLFLLNGIKKFMFLYNTCDSYHISLKRRKHGSLRSSREEPNSTILH